MIKILGLGPGAEEALTIGTINELKNCKNVFLRTEKHPTVSYLKEQDIKFETYDNATSSPICRDCFFCLSYICVWF